MVGAPLAEPHSMSNQARLPTIPQLSPDVEALLAYERDVSFQLDIVRARVLARARCAVRGNDVPPLASSLVANQHLPMLVVMGLAVVTGFAAAIELFLSTGLRQTATKVERRSDPVVDLTSVTDDHDLDRPLVNSIKAAVTNQRAAAGSQDGLEELRLLDRARQSERRGDYSAALASTREHQRRFSDGRLVEEREALRIRALMGLGRAREAGETAALFRRKFPRSVLLETIDRMMASLR